MGPHDRRVDHEGRVVIAIRKYVEGMLPDPLLRPAREPGVDALPLAVRRGQVTPR